MAKKIIEIFIKGLVLFLSAVFIVSFAYAIMTVVLPVLSKVLYDVYMLSKDKNEVMMFGVWIFPMLFAIIIIAIGFIKFAKILYNFINTQVEKIYNAGYDRLEERKVTKVK